MSSCGFFRGSEVARGHKSKSYQIDLTHPNWASIPAQESDFALLKNSTGSIILINSLCDRYAETSLKFLSQNLLSGIKSPKVLSRENSEFKGLESLKLHATGKMDDQSIELFALTARANSCVYDFILISSKSDHFSGDKEEFKKLIDTFTLIKR